MNTLKSHPESRPLENIQFHVAPPLLAALAAALELFRLTFWLQDWFMIRNVLILEDRLQPVGSQWQGGET